MDSISTPASTGLWEIEASGQMDPDTFAELLRPWQGNRHTRGPALEIVLRNGRMIVPEPLPEMDTRVEIPLKKGEALYVINIEGVRDGVSVRTNITFVGEATLLNQIDDHWMEPEEYSDNQRYTGFRFRGPQRRLIDMKPVIPAFIPATITVAKARDSDEKPAATPVAVMSGKGQTTPEGSGGG